MKGSANHHDVRQSCTHALPRRLAAKPSGFMLGINASCMLFSTAAAFASLPRLRNAWKEVDHFLHQLVVQSTCYTC